MTATAHSFSDSTMNQQKSYRFARPAAQGFLGRLLAFVLSTALFVLAFMFSLAALAIVAVAGALFAGWLWWKTRAVRKQMREASMDSSFTEGNVIEGEVVREADASSISVKLLP